MTVAPPGGSPVQLVLIGPGLPGLGTVDLLARVVVAVRRTGQPTVVRLSPDLAELVELAGLVVEVGGEPEGGEDPLGVEEEGHLGDATP